MMKPEELNRRQKWFEWYVNQFAANSVDALGDYEICPVCFWEYDGQDDHDADGLRGGPNAALSLTQARDNYRQFGLGFRYS